MIAARRRKAAVDMMMKLIVLLTYVLGMSVELASAQIPFYQDKTITVVLGGPPAGSADMRTKAVTTILRKHIPGNPTIIVQYMAAGGGRQAANHVYRGARPDGLTIGSMGAALVANAVLGVTGVQYDIDKLIYLGTPDSAQHYLFITSRNAGLTSLEKLRSTPGVRIGSANPWGTRFTSSAGSSRIDLGIKEPKFVTGYTGPEIDVALMSGEIDARAGTGETIDPSDLRSGLKRVSWTFHASIEIPIGQKGHPRFAQLPELEGFAEVDKRKEVTRHVPRLQAFRPEFFSAPGNTERTGAGSTRSDAEDPR